MQHDSTSGFGSGPPQLAPPGTLVEAEYEDQHCIPVLGNVAASALTLPIRSK